MTRFMYRLLAAFAAVALSVGAANAAPITIDNFGNPAANTSIGLPVTNFAAGSISGDLAGTLGITYNPTLTNSGGNSTSIGGGMFDMFTATSGVSVTLNYNFSGAPLDFSGMTGLFLDFSFADGGTIDDVPITVTFTTANGTSVAFDVAVDAAGNQTVDLLAGDFSNFGDLTDVTSLSITFNGSQQPGADFVLTKIYADGDGGVFDQGDPEVPEPASMILFGALAAGGLAAARRKLASRRTATV
jgi:hypothetical protein